MPRPRKRGLAYEPGPIDYELVSKAMGVFPEKEPDVYHFLCKALSYPLPAPWTEHADKKGRVFYWNPASRHSSWSHPLSSTHKSLVHAYRRIKAVPPGEERSQAVLAELEAFHKQGSDEIEQWRMSHAPDGTPYYYKTGTQQTRWDNPRDELVSHQELRICMLSELLEEPEDKLAIQDKPAMDAIEDRDLGLDDSAAAAAKPGMDVTILPDSDEQLGSKPVDTEPLEAIADKADEGLAHAELEASGVYTEPLEATWGTDDVKEEEEEDEFHRIPFRLAPDVKSLIMPFLELPQVKLDEKGLTDKHVAVGWLQPDEIGLHLGMDFGDPTDATIFAVLRPIFTADWPVPWRYNGFHHGKVDFRHPGTGELRRQHPLFWFYGELLTFLREQSVTDAPLADTMTSMILCEASPENVRNRLGVWEGPIEHPTMTNGKPLWERLVPGRDGACVKDDMRTDDPRVEAAANITARLHAWHHLWSGFAKEEPFPLIEDKIPHMATQLSESVVVIPGDRADKEWVLHQWNWELEVLSQSVDRIRQPFSKEEAELQPKVAQLLGVVYGRSVKQAAWELMPYAKDSDIAWELLRINYRHCSTRIEEEDDASEVVRDEHEIEVERERDLSESEYTDDFVEEPPEEEDVPFEPPIEDVESLDCAGSSMGHRRLRRRTRGGFSVLDDVRKEADDEERLEWYDDLDFADVNPPSEDELLVETPVESPRPVFADFLGLKYTDQASWAEHGLRPATPPEFPPPPPQPFEARSVPESHKNRGAKGFDEETWGGSKFLKVGLIRPYVANLGWRTLLEIRTAMQIEDSEAFKSNLARTTDDFLYSITESRFCSEDVRSSIAAAGDDVPWKKLQLAPLELPRLADEVQQVSHEASLRERLSSEVTDYGDTLKQSSQSFDDGLEDPGFTYLVDPNLKNLPVAPLETGKITFREGLKLAHLPIREKLQQDDMSVFSIAMRGCVPPVPSPDKAPLPVPHYLMKRQSAIARASFSALTPAAKLSTQKRSRPQSGGPHRCCMPRPSLTYRATSAEARARKKRELTSLVPERSDKQVVSEMAADGMLRWLSRKFGRVQSGLEWFDTGGDGYITRDEWAEGLEKLGYENMDHVDQIFTLMDFRGHHILTMSDLTYKGRHEASDGVTQRTPAESLSAILLHEVMRSELESVLRESMHEVLAEALQAPQAPLDSELPDVNEFLRWRRNLKRKAQGLSSESGSSCDLEADLLRSMREGSPSSQKSGGKKKKKKKGKGKFAAAGRLAMLGSRRNKSGGASSGTSTSSSPSRSSSRGRTPTGSQSASPSRRKKKKKKKKLQKTAGMLGKFLASHSSEISDTSAVSSRSASSKRGSPSRKRGDRTPKQSSSSSEGRRGREGREEKGSPSPKRSSRSPKQDRRSPMQGSTSSRIGSPSPKRSSRSPKQGSISSRMGSPSPKRSARSTKQGSTSSRLSPSPKRSSRSPKQGSTSSRPGSTSSRLGPSPKRSARSPMQGSTSSRTGFPSPKRSARSRIGSPGFPATAGGQLRPSGDGKRTRSLPRGKAKAKQRLHRDGASQRGGSASGKPTRTKQGQLNLEGDEDDISNGEELGELHPHAKQRPRRDSESGKRGPASGKFTGPKPGQQEGDEDGNSQAGDFYEELEELEAPSTWAARIGVLPLDPAAPPKQHRNEPHVSHRVGPPGHSVISRRKQPKELLPFCPQRPEDMVKTYAHIFHLLNDPSVKKRMPKQKHSVHVSMPRLPGMTHTVEAEAPAPYMMVPQLGGSGGHGRSRSVPSLASQLIAGTSTAAGSAYYAGAADTQAGAPFLPPLAKSAPDKRLRSLGSLGGDTRRGIWSG